MIDQPCIRCQQPVPLEDGHLRYCGNCGAPQIFLSEELQAEIAQQTEDYNQRSAQQQAAAGPESGSEAGASAQAERPARRQRWPQAVRYALLAAGVTLVLGLLTIPVPAMSALLVLWAIAAPILTVGMYNARHAGAGRTTSGFAARLGLLTGLMVVLCVAAVLTLRVVLARFVLHHGAAFDAQLAEALQLQRSTLLQRMGAEAEPTLEMFAVPEYRVGMILLSFGMGASFYLFASTLAAGLAGAVLQRRRSF